MEPVFFHVDLDAFFASVEQVDNPSYRGKPVIVGGLPGDRRAVVSTASYEARKYGVHSAMPLATAVKLCPNAIYVRGRHKRYHEVSEIIMDILRQYSPDVRQLSIDEAFLDMTGTERLFGTPEYTARKIKAAIEEQTKLTVSIGVASTMYVAKIASGLQKPNGLTIIPAGEEVRFMLSLPLGKLWGAGTKTLQRLQNAGFNSTADIYRASEKLLTTLFGNSTGSFLYNAVRGNKNLIFGEEAKNHSISTEKTFDFDLSDRYIIDTALMELAQIILYRLYKENARSRTIALKIRYEDFSTVSIQETSDFPIANTEDLFERCKRLFSKKYESGRGIRLLGVACENVEGNEVPQQKLLFDLENNEKKAKVEAAIYAMQQKHPDLKISKARLYCKGAK